MTHISKEQTVQYILTMVDDMLQVGIVLVPWGTLQFYIQYNRLVILF